MILRQINIGLDEVELMEHKLSKEQIEGLKDWIDHISLPDLVYDLVIDTIRPKLEEGVFDKVDKCLLVSYYHMEEH